MPGMYTRLCVMAAKDDKRPQQQRRGVFVRKKSMQLGLLASYRLNDHTGTQATSAHVHHAHGTVGELMTHTLQIGVEAALGLDVGVADQIAHLGSFAAEITFFAHGEPPYILTVEHSWFTNSAPEAP